MFEKEKQAIEAAGGKWVELTVTKPNGTKFRMLSTAEEFKKMSPSKLKKILNAK